jgi:hypothetical protein
LGTWIELLFGVHRVPGVGEFIEFNDVLTP